MLTDHKGQFPQPLSFLMARAAFSRVDLDSGVGVAVDMFLRAVVSRTKRMGAANQNTSVGGQLFNRARHTLVQ